MGPRVQQPHPHLLLLQPLHPHARRPAGAPRGTAGGGLRRPRLHRRRTGDDGRHPRPGNGLRDGLRDPRALRPGRPARRAQTQQPRLRGDRLHDRSGSARPRARRRGRVAGPQAAGAAAPHPGDGRRGEHHPGRPGPGALRPALRHGRRLPVRPRGRHHRAPPPGRHGLGPDQGIRARPRPGGRPWNDGRHRARRPRRRPGRPRQPPPRVRPARRPQSRVPRPRLHPAHRRAGHRR